MVPVVGSGCPCTTAWYTFSTRRSLNARLSTRYAFSLLATTIRPDVPTSKRCTIPCRSADPVAGSGQRPDDGRPGPAGRGVRRDTYRFVDDDDVSVVVHDPHARNRFGWADGGGSVKGGQVDAQPLPTCEPVGLCDGTAVNEHSACRREIRGPRAGDPEQPGEPGV